ncbi:hypothetical protein VTJ04DRAFT_9714 [Mycothermus thermophilus]|uniref:uncharacterized protein n=1 Tax=Humicola insolens TaxID=85995 RepID=UPI0037436C10
MCGRYAMALRPSQVRRMLQDDDMPVDDAPADEGDGAPRQAYNFAPGYHGIVYRADVPDTGASRDRLHAHATGGEGQRDVDAAHEEEEAGAGDGGGDDDDARHPADEKTQEGEEEGSGGAHPAQTSPPTSSQVRYKLQSMKWGLVPSWTRRTPDYATTLKTINCRDDSLAMPGGMWASMKNRKRCIVVAQGFYEWRKQGKEKVPHFVKRKDGKLMCFAGLWDCVRYDDQKSEIQGEEEEEGDHAPPRPLYTYTIITTSSNEQLKFLHDRMPVILEPGSEAIFTWLDPARTHWSPELQALLRPFEGELEVYPVSKDVGKVGNESPSFVIPVASRENKGNIANFFAAAAEKKKQQMKEGSLAEDGKAKPQDRTATEVKEEEAEEESLKKESHHDEEQEQQKGAKRAASPSLLPGTPVKKKPVKGEDAASPVKPKATPVKAKISATKNQPKKTSPVKAKAQQEKAKGSQKITRFFAAKT